MCTAHARNIQAFILYSGGFTPSFRADIEQLFAHNYQLREELLDELNKLLVKPETGEELNPMRKGFRQKRYYYQSGYVVVYAVFDCAQPALTPSQSFCRLHFDERKRFENACLPNEVPECEGYVYLLRLKKCLSPDLSAKELNLLAGGLPLADV